MSNICWSCKEETSDELTCSVCGKLQPVRNLNPFERLSLKVTYRLDDKELEQKYFSHQKLLHPDRYTNATKTERIYAAQHSAAVNEAYTSLKDPIRRAQALLRIYQHKSAHIEEQTLQDPELLVQVMELREQLLDASTEQDIQSLRHEIQTKFSSSLESITTAFDANDLDHAAKCLNQLRYFSKLSAEVRNKRAA